MLADDRVGRHALRPRPPRLFSGPAAHHVPEVVAVPDLAAPYAPGLLHLFGWPVQVGTAADGEGRQLGGPQASSAEWLWGVYGGPSAARRRQAMGLVDGGTLAVWQERAQARGTFAGYLGVRTI